MVADNLGSTKRVQWSFVIRGSLLILVLPYFLILTGITPLLVNFDTLLGAAVLLSLMAGAWLIVRQRAATPLGKPLLLFMAAFGVCTVFSIDFGRSLEQMALTLVGILLFALAADLSARGWPLELFFKALLVAATLIMLIVWADVLSWYRQWLSVHPGNWLPELVYRPNYANNVVMPCHTVLMLVAARWFYVKTRTAKVLLSLFALALLATIFITSSRGGWLATAAGLGALTVLLYWKQKETLKNHWRGICSKKWLLAAAAAVILVGLAGAVWLGLKVVSHPSHGRLLLSRSEFWPAAMDTFLKHPITGQGPYTFTNAYLAYNSVPPKKPFFHAHNALLNLLAEMGLVGAIPFGVALFFLARLLKRRLENAAAAELPLVMGTAAGVVALAANSISECFHMEPIQTAGLWVILGAALGEPVRTVTRKRRPYWVIAPILLDWLILWMVTPMYTGVAAANSQDLAGAEAAFQKAIEREPWSVVAHQQLGQVYALEANRQGGGQPLAKAVAELEMVVERTLPGRRTG